MRRTLNFGPGIGIRFQLHNDDDVDDHGDHDDAQCSSEIQFWNEMHFEVFEYINLEDGAHTKNFLRRTNFQCLRLQNWRSLCA